MNETEFLDLNISISSSDSSNCEQFNVNQIGDIAPISRTEDEEILHLLQLSFDSTTDSMVDLDMNCSNHLQLKGIIQINIIG